MPAYFETYRGQAMAWECDHLGHWNVQFYISRMSDAAWHLMHAIGMGPRVVRERRLGLAAAEQNIRYRREVRAGDLVVIESAILECAEKTITMTHRLINAESGEIAMTMGGVGICMDLERRAACALPPEVRAAAERLMAMETMP